VYFAQRYSKDSFFTEAIEVSKQAAIIQMRLSERTYRKLDPYRWRCAEHWCNAHKGYFVGVPQVFHGLPEAIVAGRDCIAKGDDYCEWEIAWSETREPVWAVTGSPVPSAETQDSQQLASALLTKDRPITEKGMMEFQPFGIGS